MQFHQLNSLFLSLLLLCIISSQIASGTQQQPTPPQYACDMAVAEECFGQLFDQMPICSASEESAELAFRCVHYNVLDACFSRPTEPRIKCAPKQIGHAARIAYGKRVDFCLFSRDNHYTTTAVDQAQSVAATDHFDLNSGEENQEQQQRRRSSSPHQQRRRHSHQQQQLGGIHRMPSGASIGLLAPPTELQFISLFGYLQIQCRPPIHRKSLEAKGGGNRRSQSLRDSSAGGYAQPPGIGNCSAPELGEITALCEDEIRQRQVPPHFVLERHKLLRVKLDASSKLLQFPETRPEDECLMVRSVLSDIYLIHQKYCFHATVTKCMCERLRFERSCGIQCANLEPFGLPLHRELLWSDFRGRLSGAQRTKSHPFGIPVQIAMLIIILIVIPSQLIERRHFCWLWPWS
ncbi:hypothetical protein niasHT_000904 [Heterodera trifolii]|uniref:Uncharacterized protein n=1 Tax=Heterodera trifolii TaxID=157864 RepID=A0ABD2LR59_9BILA